MGPTGKPDKNLLKPGLNLEINSKSHLLLYNMTSFTLSFILSREEQEKICLKIN